MAGLPCTPAHAARLSLQSSHRRYHEHVCCTLQCMALVSRQPHIAHVRTACRRGHGDRSATGPLRSCGALHQRPSPQPHSHTSMSAPLAGGGAAIVPAGPPPGAAQLAPAPLAPAAQLALAGLLVQPLDSLEVFARHGNGVPSYELSRLPEACQGACCQVKPQSFCHHCCRCLSSIAVWQPTRTESSVGILPHATQCCAS
jgi:hypothetical protein